MHSLRQHGVATARKQHNTFARELHTDKALPNITAQPLDRQQKIVVGKSLLNIFVVWNEIFHHAGKISAVPKPEKMRKCVRNHILLQIHWQLHHPEIQTNKTVGRLATP